MKRASMLDVSRRAGVSTATVSRVLNAPDRVSETTRKKVLAAIKELDFVKSATAFSLKAQQTNNVLVAVSRVGNIFWSEVFEGLQHRAEATGYNLVLDASTGRNGAMSVVEALRTGRVDGAIILHNEAIDPDVLDNLHALYGGTPPLVGFAEKRGAMACPHVFIDNRAGARTLTRHLIDAGHTRIGHIPGPSDYPVSDERLGGFLEEMDAAGLKVREADIFEGGFGHEIGQHVARRLARMSDRPSAVFCANDDVAMGLISELWILGLKVPEDISVVGFDNSVVAEVYVPPLTTMAQPRTKIGAAAMDLLLDVMADPKANIHRVVELELSLAKRMSVARLK